MFRNVSHVTHKFRMFSKRRISENCQRGNIAEIPPREFLHFFHMCGVLGCENINNFCTDCGICKFVKTHAHMRKNVFTYPAVIVEIISFSCIHIPYSACAEILPAGNVHIYCNVINIKQSLSGSKVIYFT